MPIGEVTYHCGCGACACIAEVSRASAVCGNCASGSHHNMITR